MIPLFNRRQLLHAGAVGVLSLPQLLRAETATRIAKPKSVILIFAWGGPAQHETFDPKPDAPAEIRGEFRPIDTNVPGIRLSEHLPKLARRADRISIVRSVSHTNRIHNPGAYYALAGRRPARDIVETPARRDDWPAIGSVLAKLQPAARPVPPYVLLPLFSNDIGIPTPGQHAGFLGVGFDPLIVSHDPNRSDFTVAALAPRAELDAARLGQRRALLGRLDEGARRWADQAAALSMDRHHERAYALVSSAASQQAFDLSKEPPTTRDRYGRTRHGQSVLLARRLIEAGVRLVMVNDNEDNGQNKRWDTHGGGFATLRKNLPETDGALSALLDDLKDRGLLETTLIVWMGEFGRSPKVDKGGGRDHWPDCYSLMLAGGGIKGGQVYGSSDARAAYPRDNPCKPEDIHATIYHAMGLSEETLLSDPLGRPLALYAGKPLPLF
jgi:hypothetical protein